MTSQYQKTNLDLLSTQIYDEPNLSAAKGMSRRSNLNNAHDEIVWSRYRLKEAEAALAELLVLRAQKKSQAETIAHLQQMLSGREETVPTVAAQAQGRGVELTPEG